MKNLLVFFISVAEISKAVVNYPVELLEALQYFLIRLLLCLIIACLRIQRQTQMQVPILYEVYDRNMSLKILQKILSLKCYVDFIAI